MLATQLRAAPPLSTSRSLPVVRIRCSTMWTRESSKTICSAAALSTRSRVTSGWRMSSTSRTASGCHICSGEIGSPRMSISSSVYGLKRPPESSCLAPD